MRLRRHLFVLFSWEGERRDCAALPAWSAPFIHFGVWLRASRHHSASLICFRSPSCFYQTARRPFCLQSQVSTTKSHRNAAIERAQPRIASRSALRHGRPRADHSRRHPGAQRQPRALHRPRLRAAQPQAASPAAAAAAAAAAGRARKPALARRGLRGQPARPPPAAAAPHCRPAALPRARGAATAARASAVPANRAAPTARRTLRAHHLSPRCKMGAARPLRPTILATANRGTTGSPSRRNAASRGSSTRSAPGRAGAGERRPLPLARPTRPVRRTATRPRTRARPLRATGARSSSSSSSSSSSNGSSRGASGTRSGTRSRTVTTTATTMTSTRTPMRACRRRAAAAARR